MEMQQPPTLDFSHPNTTFVASDAFRQEQLKARQHISNQIISQMGERDRMANTSEKSYESATDPWSQSQELRQSKQADRDNQNQASQEVKKVAQSKLGGQAEEMVGSVVRQGASETLKQLWINLPDTYGLTLIGINVYWALNVAFGDKIIPDLGNEWLPKSAKGAGKAADSLLGVPTAGIGLLEKAVIIFLDLVVAALILVSLSIVVLISYYTLHYIQAFFDLGTDLIDVLTL